MEVKIGTGLETLKNSIQYQVKASIMLKTRKAEDKTAFGSLELILLPTESSSADPTRSPAHRPAGAQAAVLAPGRLLFSLHRRTCCPHSEPGLPGVLLRSPPPARELRPLPAQERTPCLSGTKSIKAAGSHLAGSQPLGRASSCPPRRPQASVVPRISSVSLFATLPFSLRSAEGRWELQWERPS